MNDLNSNNQESLSLAIKKVIVFFDLFDYPLTAFEIFNHLRREFSLRDINDALDSLRPVLSNKYGFYFLKSRENLVELRQSRYNYSVRKLKIARRYAKIFGFFPYIKVVTLANVIGAHNMRDEGDIDFFIISVSQRLWLTRLFCAGLAKILNKRPTQEIKKDKLCLSFYITNDNLNLDELKIKPSDPYFDYWLKTMVLLYNKEENYENFLAANNLMGEYLSPGQDINKKSNKLLDRLELIAKKWQLKIMPPVLKQVLINSNGKFINDKILKLYWRDRNAEILEKFNYALNKIS
ncbi:MAG: hypothetical protein ACYC40_01460 [Patescibacteria group bacterium]